MPSFATFFLLLSVLAPAFAAPPEFPSLDAAAEALAAPDFVAREKAAHFLWSRGEAALPTLEKIAGGDGESALRARKIVGDIGLGIKPEMPGELANLVRTFHREADGDTRASILSRTAKQQGGIRLLLDFIKHETTHRKPHWAKGVTEAASEVDLAVGHDPAAPVYRELLASVQGDALPALFYHAFEAGDVSFAYDLLAYSPEVDPTFSERVRKVKNAFESEFVFLPQYADPDAPIYYPRSADAWIAEAERRWGDKRKLPAILEKLLAAPEIKNADALTAALHQQDLLPKWIEAYRKKAKDGAPASVRLALAQFLRAAGRHLEAHEMAKGQTTDPNAEVVFALLAQDWTAAKEISDDPSLASLIAQFEHSSSPFQIGASDLHSLLRSRAYREFAEAASAEPDPLKRISLSEEIANRSPILAREIIGDIHPKSLEKKRGAMGKFLMAKRRTGDQLPLVDYMSARFATITSDFWEAFLEKYFDATSPWWITDRIRTRFPKIGRRDMMHSTLTEGTRALTDEDVLHLLSEFKEVTDALRSIPPAAARNAQRIRALLATPRFGEILGDTKTWAKESFESDDPRPRLFLPVEPVKPDLFLERSGDPQFYQEAAITSLMPPPEAALRYGETLLDEGEVAEAARWFAVTIWTTAKLESPKPSHRQVTATRRLESALGLIALRNGEIENAKTRFQNLCAMGSLDHQLGTALYKHLLESVRKSEGVTLFTARWNQLESILDVAPRDAEVCRAIAAWSESCDHRTTEGEVFAQLASDLKTEQAEFEAYLKRFHW